MKSFDLSSLLIFKGPSQWAFVWLLGLTLSLAFSCGPWVGFLVSRHWETLPVLSLQANGVRIQCGVRRVRRTGCKYTHTFYIFCRSALSADWFILLMLPSLAHHTRCLNSELWTTKFYNVLPLFSLSKVHRKQPREFRDEQIVVHLFLNFSSSY